MSPNYSKSGLACDMSSFFLVQLVWNETIRTSDRTQPTVERLESGTEMGPGPRAKGPWAQLAIEQAPPHWEDT